MDQLDLLKASFKALLGQVYESLSSRTRLAILLPRHDSSGDST